MGILKFLFGSAAIAMLIVLLPHIPPDAKFSKSYKVTPSLPLAGRLSLNERLNNLEKWHEGNLTGPEAFAEYDGELYTGVHGGDIVKLSGEHIVPIVKFGRPCKGLYEERKCGRPLGLTFDKIGALYVADSYYGIFKVDVKTGNKHQLVSMDQEIGGQKPKVPNGIAVASNGDLYWSDSSTEFSLEDGVFDMFADGSGRLIHYDARTQKNTVLLDGLHFANGVKLADNEEYVLVSETANSRVHRYYLKGPKQGTHDIFLDGLPGLPDNIGSDGQGGYLFPLFPRDPEHPIVFQVLAPFPLLRKFIARMMGLIELGFKIIEDFYSNEYSQRAIHFIGHFQNTGIFMVQRLTVLRVGKNGEILEALHSTNRSIIGISDAFIFENYLYLGSPHNDFIGRKSLEEAGLLHLKSRIVKRSNEMPITQKPTSPPTKVTSPPPAKATTTSSPPKTTTTPPPPKTTTTPPPPKATTTQSPPKTTSSPPPLKTTTTQPQPKTSTTPPPPKTSTTPPPPKTSTTSPPPKTSTTPPPPKTSTTPPPPKTSTTPPPPKTSTTPLPPKTTTTLPPSKITTTPPPPKATTTPSPPKTTTSPLPPKTTTTPPPPKISNTPPPPKTSTTPPPPKTSTVPPPPKTTTTPLTTTTVPPPKTTTTPPTTITTPPPPKITTTPSPPKTTATPPPSKTTVTPPPPKTTTQRPATNSEPPPTSESKTGTLPPPLS